MTPWEIKATEFVNCNCGYGCPCQFSALPTYGNCEAVIAMEVAEGHYGDVKLDGLRTVLVYQWPGSVHEGHGKGQRIIDVRADPAQRRALLAILSGEDTTSFATHFNVYASTLDETYEPVFAKIEFAADVEARTGRIFVEGLVDTVGQPIRHIVNGEPHRVRIDLPKGFEYEIAEIGSASSKTDGRVQLELKDSYGQWCHMHLDNQGVVRSRIAA